jgi:hypothetical protein
MDTLGRRQQRVEEGERMNHLRKKGGQHVGLRFMTLVWAHLAGVAVLMFDIMPVYLFNSCGMTSWGYV